MWLPVEGALPRQLVLGGVLTAHNPHCRLAASWKYKLCSFSAFRPGRVKMYICGWWMGLLSVRIETSDGTSLMIKEAGGVSVCLCAGIVVRDDSLKAGLGQGHCVTINQAASELEMVKMGCYRDIMQ